MFHDRSLHERCLKIFFFVLVQNFFVLLVLEYCSAMWCSADNTHLELLDRVVSGARFLIGAVFECDIAHHRSVKCNPMHPLNDALPGPYVPVCVTRGELVAHRYTHAPPRFRTSRYCRTFVPLSLSLWNDLADPVLDGVGLSGFTSRASAFFLA